MLPLGGCRDNNGDIGPWYGSWSLVSVTEDGLPYTDWQIDGRTVSWSFQNNIIRIQAAWPNHDYHNFYGTWAVEGQTLLLDFTHSDDNNAAGTGQYEAPAWLLLRPGKSALHIDSQHGNTMTLTDQSTAVTYILRRTH